MKKITAAGSFLLLRLNSNCNLLIVKAGACQLQHLVGRRLSEIDPFLAANGADGQRICSTWRTLFAEPGMAL